MNSLFASLLLAHLVADFPLQTNTIFRLKAESSFGIGLHVFIHVLVMICVIEPSLHMCGLLASIAVLHFGCDWLKVQYTDPNDIISFCVDQLGHVAILTAGCQVFAMAQSRLSLRFTLPALIYVAIPAAVVLMFVLGNDLKGRGLRCPRVVEWSRLNGLALSHNFAGPVVVYLVLVLFATSLGAWNLDSLVDGSRQLSLY